MQQELIFFPALVVVALTFIVGFTLIVLRFRAVSGGEINPRYFLLNRGGKLPGYLLRIEQNYTNLLELPVLFYFLILMLYTTQKVDALQLWLAAGFAVTRIAHTLIHTTVNRLRWRMTSFVTGALLLLSGWLVYIMRWVDIP